MPQPHRCRVGGQAGHHAPQLPHPELQPQGHQGLVPLAPRPGHQHQQGVQDLADLRRAGGGQVAGEGRGEVAVIHHPALEELEQVDEELMAFEKLAQLPTPGGVPDIIGDGLRGEEEPEPGRHRRLGRAIALRLQGPGQVRPEGEHVVHRGVAEELGHRLAVLGNHRLGGEVLAEDLPGVLPQGRRVAGVPQGRGGADADQVPCRHPQPGAQAPQQQGQVRALGAVEGVQLVHHHVAQGGRGIAGPQRAVPGPQHQVVQHLVVGQQQVRGLLAQGGAVGDDAAAGHDQALAAGLGVAPHVEADPQPGEGRHRRHQFRDAPGLIAGQGVHGVDHQGLDPRLPRGPGAGAVVQHRIEKALGLAAAGARRHQGADGLMQGGEAQPGQLLVAVGRITGRKVGEEARARLAGHEGQADLHIGPLEPGRLVRDEALHQAVHEVIGGVEGRHQKLLQAGQDVPGDKGRQHGEAFSIDGSPSHYRVSSRSARDRFPW